MTKYVFLSQCCMRPNSKGRWVKRRLVRPITQRVKVPPSLTRLIQDFTEVNQAYMERERKKEHEIWFLLCISNQNFKSIDTASFTSLQKYFAQQIADLITWKKKRSKTMFKPVFLYYEPELIRVSFTTIKKNVRFVTRPFNQSR